METVRKTFPTAGKSRYTILACLTRITRARHAGNHREAVRAGTKPQTILAMADVNTKTLSHASWKGELEGGRRKQDEPSRVGSTTYLHTYIQWSRRQYFFINSLRRRAGNKFCAVNLSHDFSWPITTIRTRAVGTQRQQWPPKLTGLRYTEKERGEEADAHTGGKHKE